MKFLVVFALFLTLAVSAFAQDLSCDELEKIGENGVRKMFIIEEGASIPTTEAEFDVRCNEAKKLYKTLLEYKKCLGPFPQQIFGATSKSIGNLIKKNCADAEGKKNALKLLKCASVDKIKKGQTCAVGSMDAIEKLSKSDEGRAALLPKICCLAHVSAECGRKKLADVVCEDPTIDPKAHFEEMLATLSKDAMEIACDKYKNLQVCEAEIPAAVNELRAIVNTENNSIGQRSLIKPLLEIAKKVAN